MADVGSTGPSNGAPSVIGRRIPPPGVLPRRAQIWLMVGLAGGIVAIVAFTGRAPESSRQASTAPRQMPVPNTDQLRSYQRRLEEADPRVRSNPPGPSDLRLAPRPVEAAEQSLPQLRDARPSDAIAEERRRREYESLFASNVVQSMNPTLSAEASRYTGTKRVSEPAPRETSIPNPPSLDDVAAAVLRASTTHPSEASATQASPTLPTASAGATVSPAGGRQTASPETTPSDGPLHRILEGTIVDAVLTNRLDGTVAAPVNCLVSAPIYTADRQQVLIPAGARILGATRPVQSFGETRLAVAFTRLVLPNGRTFTLDHFMGLNQIGDAGLRDQVNQHYLTTFGAAAAVGVIAGFGQLLATGFGDRTGPVIITGNLGESTAQAASQTMNHFLNRLPTVTIREGHRIKVYLTSDLELPVYRAGQSPTKLSEGASR